MNSILDLNIMPKWLNKSIVETAIQFLVDKHYGSEDYLIGKYNEELIEIYEIDDTLRQSYNENRDLLLLLLAEQEGYETPFLDGWEEEQLNRIWELIRTQKLNELTEDDYNLAFYALLVDSFEFFVHSNQMYAVVLLNL